MRLHRGCTGATLWLHWGCTEAALGLRWGCTGSALRLHWGCIAAEAALGLHQLTPRVLGDHRPDTDLSIFLGSGAALSILDTKIQRKQNRRD